MTLKPKQLNGIKPSIIVLFTPKFRSLQYANIFSVKKSEHFQKKKITHFGLTSGQFLVWMCLQNQQVG